MLAIRLARVGAKKKPTYRVVVMDKRLPRNSKTVEIVGHYNPRPDPMDLLLKSERIEYWIGQGAQPSDTVRRLIGYKAKGGAVSDSPKTSTVPITPVRDTPREEPAAEQAAPPTEAVAASEAVAEPEAAVAPEVVAAPEAEESGSTQPEASGEEPAATDSGKGSEETS